MTTPTTVSVRLQLRADTAANWTSANPTLLANELGRETDTGKIKIGDGSTAWSSLAYQAWATLPIAVASGGTGQTSYTNGQLLIGNTTGNTLTKATLTAGSGIAITNGTGSITVAASGISDAQIAADAEIAVSKLADGTARQLLQTDAAGTGVEWASNIDIPGTLDVTSAATFDSTIGASAGTASLPSITFTGDLNTGIYSPGADQVAISTAGTGRLFVDGSGRVLVGTSSARAAGGHTGRFQLEGTNYEEATASIAYNANDANGGYLHFIKTRTGNTVVQSGDLLGHIRFYGTDGSAPVAGVSIKAEVDGTPGANDMPGRLVLSTTADGTSSPTERLRITSAGLVGIGTSTPGSVLDVRFATSPATDNGNGANALRVWTTNSVAADAGGAVSLGGTSGAGQGAFGQIAGRKTNATAEDYAGYLQFSVNGSGGTMSEKMRLTGTGLGIGTTSPTAPLTFAGSTGQKVAFYQGIGGYSIGVESSEFRFVTDSGGFFSFRNGANYSSASEYMRLDSSGRLLVGTSTATNNLRLDAKLAVVSTGSNNFGGINFTNYGGTAQNCASFIDFNRSRGTTDGSLTSVASGDDLGYLVWRGATGSVFDVFAEIRGQVDGTPGSGDAPGRLVFSTTADGASSPTERMRIKQDGSIRFGPTGGVADQYFSFLRTGTPENTAIFNIYNNTATSIHVCTVNQDNWNAVGSALALGKNSSTSRSISAGGTINASGADYAEYMVKAGDFTIAKGAVCGVTADGLLTLDYADAVSFVVKSTNPSYVGGDTWGSEDVVGKKPEAEDTEALAQWEADLEAARQQVDRIAFAGQVPVNVMGATPGQYIVPVEAADGGIEGIAKNKSDMTAAEYMDAVGKVIAIEDDGRARIIVKVA